MYYKATVEYIENMDQEELINSYWFDGCGVFETKRGHNLEELTKEDYEKLKSKYEFMVSNQPTELNKIWDAITYLLNSDKAIRSL